MISNAFLCGCLMRLCYCTRQGLRAQPFLCWLQLQLVFVLFLCVKYSSSTRQQSKWRHNAGFSLKAPVLINKKCCASMSAFLLLCVLSKCELVEGCQYVLQSHCWLCCSHTCREEPAQESPSSIIHTATSNGDRALPMSSPLPYCSVQLYFCLVVHLKKSGKG